MKKIVLMVFITLCLASYAKCDEAFTQGLFDLPPAELEEIRERGSLEVFRQDKNYFLKDDYDKERRALYPKLFPEYTPHKSKYEFFVRKGSFDYSAFGVHNAADNENYYYTIKHSQNKTAGETDYFKSRSRDIILQYGAPSAFINSEFFVYGGGLNLESGLYRANTATGGAAYQANPFGNLGLSAGLEMSKSVLNENSGWVNVRKESELKAHYSPFEPAVISAEYGLRGEQRRRLDLSREERGNHAAFSLFGDLSVFDYLSVGSGYVRQRGRNFAAARASLPLMGFMRLQAQYDPGISVYDFQENVAGKFKYSAYPKIESNIENSPFSGSMEANVLGDSLRMELGARRSKVKNYLVWVSSGEFLSPVFLDSVDERRYNMSAYYKSKQVSGELSVLGNFITDNANGLRASGEPRWKLRCGLEFLTKYADFNIAYERESSKIFGSGQEQKVLGSQDVVSAGVRGRITQSIFASAAAENVFSKRYADRPIYSREKTNYSIGINVLF